MVGKIRVKKTARKRGTITRKKDKAKNETTAQSIERQWYANANNAPAFFLAGDPGANGAIVVLGRAGRVVQRIRLAKSIPPVVANSLQDLHMLRSEMICGVEEIHANPRSAYASMRLGEERGLIVGILAGVGLPSPYEIKPTAWQTDMACKTGGDKGVTRFRANQLCLNRPEINDGIDWTDADADAYLMAEWMRRIFYGF